MHRMTVLIIAAGMLLFSSCSQEQTLPLTQTYVIPDFGYSIAYPDGWLIDTDDTITWIFETEADFQLRYFDQPEVDGIAIAFDHRSIDWLVGELGLAEEDPSLNDLFQLNIQEISGMQDPTITETALFGADALKSEFYEDQWHISYAGYIEDEAFLLIVTAPTKEALEEFKPTWEAMISTIQPVSE